MSMSEILRREPVTLSPSDSVSRAAELLVEEHVLALPVVEDGKLVGVFGLHELVELLMPRAVRLMNQGLEGLTDLDFVADTLDEVRERMGHVCETEVGEHLERGSERTPLDPDSSFTEALFLVYKLGRDLPVVEKKTGRLAGMVSPWDVLERIRRR
ncbi:MAG TPA: CBS domain-containing protein [Gemmatimonadota bacterium]|nr:CBS domain-containing protein [Gemmatimonadota bacterium]